jgi:hypothetical protein
MRAFFCIFISSMKRFLQYTGLLLPALLAACLVSAQVFVPAEKDPRYSTELNPVYNNRVNPTYNPQINPKFNAKLNPKYTPEISPKFNANLNPQFNFDLNPKMNTALNPEYNYQLVPRYGVDGGIYMFDKNANLTGIIMPASANVWLLFDDKNNWRGYFVRTGSNWNRYTIDGTWTGEYLCPNDNRGYNYFTEEGSWTGEYVIY